MQRYIIETPRLTLTVTSLEEARIRIDAMSATDKLEVSAEWLSLLESATSADPWILGFNMVHRDTNELVGQCGFKGPPSENGDVEIAYAVEPQSQGQGYATEAAQALVEFAFGHQEVQRVLAHTLPESNASAQVLTKCGFRNTGKVTDPEDGPVWQWEQRRDTA